LANYFTPDGSLICEKDNNEKIISDWLDTSCYGPYSESDATLENVQEYYYLGGMFRFANCDVPKYGRLQVCSNPLNILSVVPIDEIHCWVYDEKE
jgi:hypothetical protein